MTDTKRPAKRSRQTSENRLSKVASVSTILGNAAVIGGIIFAIVQFSHTIDNEKVQNAINAVNLTRSSEFLKAYARLKTAYELENFDNKIILIDDLNYVMNSYDNLALLYIKNLADRCVIKDATYSALMEIPPISDALSYPKEHRKNLDRLLMLMDKEVCE